DRRRDRGGQGRAARRRHPLPVSLSGPSLPGTPKGVVAVLDTSVLVRAWRSTARAPNAARRVMLLAGVAYDSFTSPAILGEVAEVLARPRFSSTPSDVYSWLDAFVRASRQVFPESVPGDDAGAVRGHQDDLPILKTAYAVFAAASEYPSVLEQAG